MKLYGHQIKILLYLRGNRLYPIKPKSKEILKSEGLLSFPDISYFITHGYLKEKGRSNHEEYELTKKGSRVVDIIYDVSKATITLPLIIQLEKINAKLEIEGL